ncbi:hypothetical protein KGO06_02125 [Patescibacteria group bacterium]|nr:hypothetical protein [Patescibacteria group bacterium]
MEQQDKAAILASIRQAVESGIVRNDEIRTVLQVSSVGTASAGVSEQNTISRVTAVQLIQYIGGFIVLLGIGTFVATFWQDIGSLERVSIAFGGALATYILGLSLMTRDTVSHSGVAFQLIAGSLFPFGFAVVFEELFGLNLTPELLTTISAVLLVGYALTYLRIKHVIFTIFMLLHSITFLYAGVYSILPDLRTEFFAHLTLIVGAAGIYIGSTFRGTLNEPLASLMYFLGSVAMLVSPALVFGSTPIWELLYPFLISFVLYIALLLKSKRILIVSVLSIMWYVMYLTGEYFADIVGWPVALILSGILLIVIGYLAVRYKDKVI